MTFTIGICILPSLNPVQVAARHSVQSQWMEGRNGRAFNGPTSRKGHHRKIAQREEEEGRWRSPWISGNRYGIPDERKREGERRETGSSLAFHAFRAGFAAVVVLFCRSVSPSAFFWIGGISNQAAARVGCRSHRLALNWENASMSTASQQQQRFPRELHMRTNKTNNTDVRTRVQLQPATASLLQEDALAARP